MKVFMFKMENDPRIIGSGADGSKHGLGWFIRKTSLDEFPQFWNVQGSRFGVQRVERRDSGSVARD